MRTSKALQKKIKLVRVLHDKKTRAKANKFIIEGIRTTESALGSNIDFDFVLYTKKLTNNKRGAAIIKKCKKKGIECTQVSNEIINNITQTETSQGILSVIEQREYVLSQLALDNKFCFLVLIDSVQDPGNMGTIIRTAEAAGADGVIISKGSVDIFNPKTVRSSMGSIFNIPIVKTQSLRETIKFLKGKGIRIFATDNKGKESYFNCRYSGKIGLLLGNEAQGLKSDMVSLADSVVKIPMLGKSESLNVATAASILIYERTRQNWKYLTRKKK